MYGLSTSIIVQTVSPNANSFKSNTKTTHRKIFPLPPAVPDGQPGPVGFFYKDLTFTGTGGISHNPDKLQLTTATEIKLTIAGNL